VRCRELGSEGLWQTGSSPFLELVNGCHQPGGKVPPGHDHHLLSESAMVESALLRPSCAVVCGKGSGSWLAVGSLFRPLPWHVDVMSSPSGMLGTPEILLTLDSLNFVFACWHWQGDFIHFARSFFFLFLPFLNPSFSLPFLSSCLGFFFSFYSFWIWVPKQGSFPPWEKGHSMSWLQT